MQARQVLKEKQAQFPPAENYVGLVDEILSNLRPRMPKFISHLIEKDRLVVGPTSEDEPRLYIDYQEDRSYAIILHEDLLAFIYRITRAALSQISIKAQGIDYAAKVDDRRFAQIIADILWWFHETGTVFGPEYSTSPHHLTLD